MIAALLAACGGGVGPGVVEAPTATVTVIATGLPTVPPPVKVGAAENPLKLVMVPVSDRAGAEEAAHALADLLSYWPDPPPTSAPLPVTEESTPTPGPNATPTATPTPSYYIAVELVNTQAEVIERVCAHDAPAVGWVDGWTYLRAEASGCAVARYLVVGRDGQTGVRSMIVRHAPYLPVPEGATPPTPINTTADLIGRRFCRLRYDDEVSWRIPALMMKAAGVDPVTGLAGVGDYESVEDLIRAVYKGECDAAGMPPDALDGLDLEALGLDKLQPVVDPFDPADAEALAAAQINLPPLDRAVVPLETSIEIPTRVMIYPRIVQFDARTHLEALLAFLVGEGADENREPRDEAIARALATLQGVESLRPVTEESFAALRTFMARTGLDPVALGK